MELLNVVLIESNLMQSHLLLQCLSNCLNESARSPCWSIDESQWSLHFPGLSISTFRTRYEIGDCSRRQTREQEKVRPWSIQTLALPSTGDLDEGIQSQLLQRANQNQEAIEDHANRPILFVKYVDTFL